MSDKDQNKAASEHPMSMLFFEKVAAKSIIPVAVIAGGFWGIVHHLLPQIGVTSIDEKLNAPYYVALALGVFGWRGFGMAGWQRVGNLVFWMGFLLATKPVLFDPHLYPAYAQFMGVEIAKEHDGERGNLPDNTFTAKEAAEIDIFKPAHLMKIK